MQADVGFEEITNLQEEQGLTGDFGEKVIN